MFSVVIKLESHAVVNFVILKSDVILVHRVPFLNSDFLWTSASLCSNELLEVSDSVIRAAIQYGPTVMVRRRSLLDQVGCVASKWGTGGVHANCLSMRTVLWRYTVTTLNASQKTHLHFTLIFLPRRSLQITSIILEEERSTADPRKLAE